MNDKYSEKHNQEQVLVGPSPQSNQATHMLHEEEEKKPSKASLQHWEGLPSEGKGLKIGLEGIGIRGESLPRAQARKPTS